MKKLVSIIFALIISLSSLGQMLIERIPIILIDNLIFIKIKVNDSSESLNFIFDTGAGITVIDSKIAQQLYLPITGELKVGTSGKSLITELSENNKLVIGNKVALDSISLALMDLSHLSNYLKSNVDGIIGFDLLDKIIMETNINAMEMRLFSNSSFVYKGNAKPLKLIQLESNHLGLPIEVVPKGGKNGIALIVKIDTAAGNYLTFHNETVTAHKLIKPNRRYKTKKGFGADATVTSNLDGKVSSAIFCAKKWKNIPVVFEVDPLNKSSKRLADGLIGQKMLLDFNITYNLKGGVVYLESRK